MIATHNPGKLAEMRELLAPHGVEAISAGELRLGEPEETGQTFRANAAIKAIAAAEAAQLPAFADDSGIVVDALDGAPGIYSARWAGEGKDFMAAMSRIERLLQERGATTPDKRTAHFVSALCVAWPDGHLEEVEDLIAVVEAVPEQRNRPELERGRAEPDEVRVDPRQFGEAHPHPRRLPRDLDLEQLLVRLPNGAPLVSADSFSISGSMADPSE